MSGERRRGVIPGYSTIRPFLAFIGSTTKHVQFLFDVLPQSRVSEWYW